MALYQKPVSCPDCAKEASLVFISATDSYHLRCEECGCDYNDSADVDQTDEQLDKAIQIIQAVTKDGWPHSTMGT